jgi:hypothetical protein
MTQPVAEFWSSKRSQVHSPTLWESGIATPIHTRVVRYRTWALAIPLAGCMTSTLS